MKINTAMQYITPRLRIVDLRPVKILCGSAGLSGERRGLPGFCNRGCQLWHTCRDREDGKYCDDYRS